MQSWRERARQLQHEVYAIYLAYRNPRVPWYARAWAACVVAYAFSPIDLIPDFVPILGYVDDLLLIPLGIAVAIRMIPPAVLAECRGQAQAELSQAKPVNWVAAAVIVAIWFLLAAAGIALVARLVTAGA
jgi:uncharacterized membrane protein YkvA (DUF1232 family)